MDLGGQCRLRPRRALGVHYPRAEQNMNCRNLTRSLITLAWLVLMASKLSASDPRLAVTYNGGNLILRWPVAEGGWVLDQSPGLNAPTSWTRVPPALYQIAGTNMAFAASPSVGNMFYRLRMLSQSGPAIPGLTGNWNLDEGQGQFAQDSAGHQNRAGLTNTAWTAGRIGPSALSFNGAPAGGPGASRAWISNTNYRVLPPPGQPFSVSLWFSPDALTNGWQGLIGNAASAIN